MNKEGAKAYIEMADLYGKSPRERLVLVEEALIRGHSEVGRAHPFFINGLRKGFEAARTAVWSWENEEMADLQNKNQASYLVQKKKVELQKRQAQIVLGRLKLDKQETENKIFEFDIKIEEEQKKIDMFDKQINWLQGKVEEDKEDG